MTAGFAAAVRLDFAESRRSRWVVFAAGTYALLGAIFVLVGLRESALFGFTGMGRVLFSLCHALVLVIPLLALMATVQVVNRAREDGTLEFVFSLPIGRLDWFGGVKIFDKPAAEIYALDPKVRELSSDHIIPKSSTVSRALRDAGLPDETIRQVIGVAREARGAVGAPAPFERHH